MICIIAAVAANGIIGANGAIPWDIPEDRAHFRELTTGGAVIMGRRTYESIGRPLPERYNIVVSGAETFTGKMLRTAGSLKDALKLAERHIRRRGAGDIFLCGGAEIYRQGLEYAERLYLTELYDDYYGDVSFPGFDRDRFRLAEVQDHPELRLRYCTYVKE